LAHSGDVLEHPITGEKFIYLKTARDTGGAVFQLELYGRPGAFAAAAHIHPRQSEQFTVLSGTLTARVAGKELHKVAGDEFVIPAGTPHVWWNSGDDELHMIVEFRPALRTENFFESFFGLAQDGKVNRKTGLPNLVQTAMSLRAYRNEIILAQPPRLVQTLVFGVLAGFGKLLGYTGEYPYPYAKQALAQPQQIQPQTP
jgi:quercetin dioxygenase-like cupin family protein